MTDIDVIPMADPIPAPLNGLLIMSVQGPDIVEPYVNYGLTFESSEQDILTAVRGVVQERFGVDIRGQHGEWLFKTRKALESQNIHVLPNSVAGLT